MTALLLTACVGMITGAFLIFRISPMDFTLGVFRRLTAGPKSIRDEINETTHRKKHGLFRREISEAQTVLQATGKEERFPVLCAASLLLFAVGAGIAIIINNLLLVPVLAAGMMFLPFWYIKLTAGHYRKAVTAELETALSIITTAYLRSEDLQTAVEEDINFAEALDQSFKKIHTGEKVKGTVCSVNDSEAIVDVGTKHTGYVPRSELTDDASKKPSDVVAVGDVLDLIVTKINDQEGIVTLSKKKVDEMKGFEEIIKAKDEEAVLEGTVSASVKGGVIINYAGVRVFIPASQSGLPRGAEMDSLVKTTQRFVILEVNEQIGRAHV